MRRLFACVFYGAAMVFATDALLVIFAGGVVIHLYGVELRSMTIEFPVIAFAVSGLLALWVGGKWRDALLLCAALAGGGVVAESALRVLYHPLAQAHVDYAAWYRPSEYFGHELVPRFEGFGPLNVPIKINAEGFRDGDHQVEKPLGVVRILGLGDSFLFGWGVSAEEVFLTQLETRLRVTSGRIEAINTGVPGWGLNQYYLYLQQKGRQLSPDLVVLAYFVDDLNGSPVDHISPNLEYQGGLKYKGGILHHSRLYNFLKSLGHLVREKNRTARVGYLHDLDLRRMEWSRRANYLMSRTSNEVVEPYTGYLTGHLLRLKSSTAEMGAGFVLMLIPGISQLHHPEVQHINRLLRDVCKDLAIPFLDMTPIFEQSDDPGRFYLWPKDPHTNVQGHEEMAKALQGLICHVSAVPEVRC